MTISREADTARPIKPTLPDEQDLAESLARSIMAAGDQPGSRCQRIEFKGGSYAGIETAQGGMCESALAGHIRLWLVKHGVDLEAMRAVAFRAQRREAEAVKRCETLECRITELLRRAGHQ